MVLLIGGPSATGKSTLAEALARRYDARYLDSDLFYIAFRKVVPAESAPVGLHAQDEAFWARPPDELVRDYLALQAYMCQALEVVVAQHCRAGQRVVMEGAWLLPAFVKQGVYDDR